VDYNGFNLPPKINLSALNKECDRKNGSDGGNWLIKYSHGSPKLVQKN